MCYSVISNEEREEEAECCSILRKRARILVFVSFFVPIRMVAGGAHASSYKNCWCISNLIAIGCVVAGSWISKLHIPIALSIVLLIVTIGYIWKVVPVRLAEGMQSELIINRNRKYSRVILVVEAVCILGFLGNGNGRVYYTAAVTSYIVAIMIWIAIKEERRKCHE